MKVKIKIKPLSVNDAWQGKRYRSYKYEKYRNLILNSLKGRHEKISGKLFVFYEFGFSSSSSDIDNPVKCIQDVVFEHYGINDNRVYFSMQKKTLVKQGEEFVKINIIELPKIINKLMYFGKLLNIY